MTRIKRPAAATGAAALLAFSLTACGGGPPTDASVEDFCAAVNDDAALEDLDLENPDPEKFLEAIQKIADELEEVGTPEDIPDDAREGFEISLEQVDSLDADDIDFEADEDPFEAGLSEDEKKKVEAFNEYESETCSE